MSNEGTVSLPEIFVPPRIGWNYITNTVIFQLVRCAFLFFSVPTCIRGICSRLQKFGLQELGSVYPNSCAEVRADNTAGRRCSDQLRFPANLRKMSRSRAKPTTNHIRPPSPSPPTTHHV